MVTAWERPALLAEIESSHIRQYADFFEGSRDQVATLTGYTGNGVLLKLRAQHANATPIQVRNAADTLTTFEVNNATGLLLGGVQDGAKAATPSAGGPSVGFNSQPGVGLYLDKARGAPYRVGVSTGRPSATLTLGAVPTTYLPYDGLVNISVQQVVDGTPDAVQAGVTVTHGSVGPDKPVTPQGPAFSSYQVIHTTAAITEHQGINVVADAVSGVGATVFGIKVATNLRGTYGSGGTIKGATAAALYSTNVPGMAGGAMTNTGMLISVTGQNANDQLHGIELVIGTKNGDAAVRPRARIGLIISCKDAATSQRGNEVDQAIMIGRKANVGDWANFNSGPWLHGIMFGDGWGELESYPFTSDSHAICFDHNQPGNAAYNTVGAGIHFGTTSCTQAALAGGSGEWANVFDFPNVKVSVPSPGKSYIFRVGAVFGIKQVGSIAAQAVYLGLGTADPASPIDIVDPPTPGAMRFRGSNALGAPDVLATPTVSRKRLIVYFHDGSNYQQGWIPIY